MWMGPRAVCAGSGLRDQVNTKRAQAKMNACIVAYGRYRVSVLSSQQ